MSGTRQAMKSAINTLAPPAPVNGSAGSPPSSLTRVSSAPSNGIATSSPKSEADALRGQILDLVGKYCQAAFGPKPFFGGESAVPVSCRVCDEADVQRMVASALDFWLT